MRDNYKTKVEYAIWKAQLTASKQATTYEGNREANMGRRKQNATTKISYDIIMRPRGGSEPPLRIVREILSSRYCNLHKEVMTR